MANALAAIAQRMDLVSRRLTRRAGRQMLALPASAALPIGLAPTVPIAQASSSLALTSQVLIAPAINPVWIGQGLSGPAINLDWIAQDPTAAMASQELTDPGIVPASRIEEETVKVSIARLA